MKELNNNKLAECKNCPHTVQHKRRFGATIHCTIEPSGMDVTYTVKTGGKTLLCPLLKKEGETE